jgi:hypothetical protein
VQDYSLTPNSEMNQSRSTYGGKMYCAEVSRVVHTTKLQGTTGCHIKLMKIATDRRTRRGSIGQTRPQDGVAGSLATSGCYRQCSVVACKETDRSPMVV